MSIFSRRCAPDANTSDDDAFTAFHDEKSTFPSGSRDITGQLRRSASVNLQIIFVYRPVGLYTTIISLFKMPAIRGIFQLSAQARSRTSGREFGQLMGSGSESGAQLGGMKNREVS